MEVMIPLLHGVLMQIKLDNKCKILSIVLHIFSVLNKCYFDYHQHYLILIFFNLVFLPFNMSKMIAVREIEGVYFSLDLDTSFSVLRSPNTMLHLNKL